MRLSKKTVRFFLILFFFIFNKTSESLESLPSQILLRLPEIIEYCENVIHLASVIYNQAEYQRDLINLQSDTKTLLSLQQFKLNADIAGLTEPAAESFEKANTQDEIIKIPINDADSRCFLTSFDIETERSDQLPLLPTNAISKTDTNVSQLRSNVQILSHLDRIRQNRDHNIGQSIESIIEKRNELAFQEIRNDRSKAQSYVNNVEKFCELIIGTNSTDYHTRISSRLTLPYVLDHGPLYEEKYNALKFLVPCFYDKNLKIKTEIIPELTDKIVSVLYEINQALRNKPDLYKVYTDLDCNHLKHYNIIFTNLLTKAYENKLYNIEYYLNTDREVKTYYPFFQNNREFTSKIIVNEENFKLAQVITELSNAFDINQEANYKKAEKIYRENIKSPIVVNCFKSFKEKNKIKFAKDIALFKNDPLFKSEIFSQHLKSNFDHYYKCFLFFNKRYQIKSAFMKQFGINYGYTNADKILYELIDSCNDAQKQIKILTEIATNKNLNVKSEKLYNLFYSENGILKCYRNNPFAKEFKLNSELAENTKLQVIINLNKILAFKIKTPKEAEIVKSALNSINSANANKYPVQHLKVSERTIEALNGNKDYRFIVDKQELLKNSNGILETYDRILKQESEIEKGKAVSLPEDQEIAKPQEEEKKEEAEKVIEDESKIAEVIKTHTKHIFSPKHVKNGIFNLSPKKDPEDKKADIRNEIEKKIKDANKNGTLKEGYTNQIQGFINGNEVEIRVDIKNGIVRSVDCFRNWSSRNLGNIIRS